MTYRQDYAQLTAMRTQVFDAARVTSTVRTEKVYDYVATMAAYGGTNLSMEYVQSLFEEFLSREHFYPDRPEEAGPVCFWHPVGPHAGESLEQITARKRGEIDAHGYTLWSFAPAAIERVEAWRRELRARGQTSCEVVCCGDTTADPHDGPAAAVRWMAESSWDMQAWTAVPPRMTSYHRPAGKSGVVASGFVVQDIQAPQEMRVARPTRWLRANMAFWDDSPVPTRGEYMIAPPEKTEKGRTVRLLLTLREPFVVWLR